MKLIVIIGLKFSVKKINNSGKKPEPVTFEKDKGKTQVIQIGEQKNQKQEQQKKSFYR